MSHLKVAISACEDFECDFKGAGPKEAKRLFLAESVGSEFI
jgi:hypothetical protein